ncbi:Alpha/Beta hydrolase protein [Chytridium lagenaria]|nr:Alpha/Beta hydrolase protein [Chytridium lagenaria]
MLRYLVVALLSVSSVLAAPSHRVHVQSPESNSMVDRVSMLKVETNVALCDPDVKQLLGYLDVDDKHFFFWFFESRSAPSTDPLVLWLNGGPGCSSLTGLFMELGPCRVGEVFMNTKANTIFLDQPTDVGFSYSDNGEGVATTTDAAADVYSFLQLFLAAYQSTVKNEFHVTGESYAGNGMTDPAVQYEYYAKFACGNSYGPVLDQAECDSMASRYPFCRSLIDACYKYEGTFSCVPGGVYCNNAMIGPFQKTGLNIYDIRRKCDPSNPLCYSILSDIEAYLNRPDVQLVLGVDHSYTGVRILIYAGDSDYICNWMGNEAWTLALEWEGQEGFNAAPVIDWTSKITGRKAGVFRSFNGLAFLRVFEAGHMVPYDQPEHSVEFINKWMAPKEFAV